MTSEREDIDNERNRARVTAHSSFPSENEDIDNMRRCMAAGIPSSISSEYLLSQTSRCELTGLTPWQLQNEPWHNDKVWRKEDVYTKKSV
jgi:hypothetical protein